MDVKKGVSTLPTTKRLNTKIILIAKRTFCLHFPCANANITFEQLRLFMGETLYSYHYYCLVSLNITEKIHF